ncbi:MAG: hydantoinase/oxoprolinase family protein [Desulfovibrio sp.]|nr:hydantoinase/oxoprolinase family protein [Desulfovibrio sp.]
MATETRILGIDCGGTHTDAALLAVNGSTGEARLLASAKTRTRHENLPASISEAVHELNQAASLETVERATFGTTLEINSLVQGNADKVGLALSAGPGLDPAHFALGEAVCIVPGGLDHRGVEVGALFLDTLEKEAASWSREGIAAIACVGKFSPRNPAHEQEMARVAGNASGLPVCMGHTLSGKLNFPRRIATAYYNAAVAKLHNRFLDAVENGLEALGIRARLRLLKADGGAIPFAVSRKTPVESILSGPAASVMGALALWPRAESGCALLLDMGGTTTDIALLLNGSPVVDRRGMTILGRRTLVRSLASVSIGVGGDSVLKVAMNGAGKPEVEVGPEREGPAMAFGGGHSTFLDSLNALDGENSEFERGDVAASIAGMKALAREAGLGEDRYRELALLAVEQGLAQISKAVYDLVEGVNARPVYTLAALKAAREARPVRACLVGGPARCLRGRLAAALGLDVEIAPCSQVANAIGAALTLPTASLELYADTGRGELSAPAVGFHERIPANYTLEQAAETARMLLAHKLASDGSEDARVEAIEQDLFATLDDHGQGARDMRVVCQAVPGIVAKLKA